MPAYLIADLRIINRPRYEEYRLAVREVIRGHGGRHVVLTSKVDVLEGNWAPPRVAVIEFPTMDAAEAFYHSGQYQLARGLRANAAMADMVLAEGIAPARTPNSGQRLWYAVSDTRIINRARHGLYADAVKGIMKQHKGRYLAVTESVKLLEGSWEPHCLILMEFHSESGARAALAAVRAGAVGELGVNSAMSDLVLVPGLAAESEENSTFL